MAITRDLASVVLYVVLYVAFDILIADSGRSGAFTYNVATVVFLTEFGKFLFSVYFWLAEYLAWNNRSVLIIRNDVAKVDLVTKDNKKEKKTFIRKVRFKSQALRRSCIVPFGSEYTIRSKRINTVEGNWPVTGDELVQIRRCVSNPVKGTTVERFPLPKWESIKSTENLWHRLRTEQMTTASQNESRLELIFKRSATLKQLFVRSSPMLIPAFMYTVWNIINFEALLRVNLAEYSILYQINLLFTIIFWTGVFQKRFNWLQWLGVLCMVVGCAFTRVGDKTFKFTWSWSLLYVITQAFISAVAGVLNEVVYKCRGEGMQQLTLHVQNTALYGYSSLLTFTFMVARRIADPNSMKNLFQGFDSDWRPLLIVLMGVVIGLNVSFILKKLSNVVKVFAAAIHAPIEVVFAHFILGTRLTWAIGLAASLIVVALLLFKGSNEFMKYLPCLKCEFLCRKRKRYCGSKSKKGVSAEGRLMCCFKTTKYQELLELEDALDEANKDTASAKRRRSNSEAEVDVPSTPLVDPMQKIREYEEKYGLPKTHYWALDSVDVTVDGYSASKDFQTAVV